MNTNDFKKPDAHPYGLLSGYTNASEKENVLAWMLVDCIEKGSLETVHDSKHSHPTMVEDGLLEEVSERKYKLTKKSIGLLYSVYGI